MNPAVVEPPVSRVEGNEPAAEPSRRPIVAPAWLQRGRIPCLDGLRAVSILLVLLAHGSATRGFPQWGSLRKVAPFGVVGVDVFFVISGFLITLLLMREVARTGRVSIRGFYVRRILRIVPAYLFYLAALGVLAVVGICRMDGRDWLLSLTYTVPFGRHHWVVDHAWSLSVEEHFYLVWPLLFAVAGTGRARWLAAVSVPLAVVCRWVLSHHAPAYIEVHHLTPARMDSLGVGCLLALLAGEGWFHTATRSLGRGLLPLGAALLAVLAASVYVSSTRPGVYSLVAHSANALCIAGILWICVNRAGSRVGRLLEARPLVFLGVLSYSIYLWQQLFLTPDSPLPLHRWPLSLVWIGAAACISYYLVERPFLRWKDREGGRLRHA